MAVGTATRESASRKSIFAESVPAVDLAEFDEVLREVTRVFDAALTPTDAIHDFATASAVLNEAWSIAQNALAGDRRAQDALEQSSSPLELMRRLTLADRTIRAAEVQYRDRAIKTARSALEDLAHINHIDQLIQAGAVAVCRLGFDRAIVSRVDESIWTTEYIHVDGDSEWAEEILAAGRSAPQQILPGLPEQDLIRRRRPILVNGVQERVLEHSQIHRAVAEVSRSRSYVAAAITPGDQMFGFLHGDRFFHAGDLDQFDCDLLGLFAQGYSYALERAQLSEKLNALQLHIRGVAASLEDVATGIAAPMASGHVPQPRGGLYDAVATHGVDGDGTLTRREVDVLSLMANGDTNHRIARRLVISEGTVKSHVKHILRKLGAANRAEAVARWHQAAQRSQHL